ncbi:MAG: pre-peptidase C-terminal domain-containing protein, partial [Acidimicrobiia bacterium]
SDWTPAALRSAFMTTAHTGLRTTEGGPAGPFDMGAGRIDPGRAGDPGVVLEVTSEDYRRLVEGIDPDLLAGDPPPLAPAELNLPSVSLSSLAGRATVHRTVTGTTAEATEWRAAVQGLDGIAVTVTPDRFTLAPGRRQTLELSFTTHGAPNERYASGTLVLTPAGKGTPAHLPLTAQPVIVDAPRIIGVTTADPAGRHGFEVQAGFDGTLVAQGFGFGGPRTSARQTIATGDPDTADFTPGPALKVYDVEVQAGAQLLRGEITDTDADTDLDLFLLYDAAGNGFGVDDLVAESARADSKEAITAVVPEPGRYRFAVFGFTTQDPTSSYDFTSWLVDDPTPDDPADPPGMAVTGDPVRVAEGDRVSLELRWSGVPRGVSYGVVGYRPESDGTFVVISLVRLQRT